MAARVANSNSGHLVQLLVLFSGVCLRSARGSLLLSMSDLEEG